jgi:hypothetical protein
MNLQETQRNLARCEARYAGCSVHSSLPLNEEEKKKVGKRKGNSDEEDGKSKNKISKDGTTTTTLEASANARLENGVEIVTKTVVGGDAVTTVTTTALIPLAVSSLKRTTGD